LRARRASPAEGLVSRRDESRSRPASNCRGTPDVSSRCTLSNAPIATNARWCSRVWHARASRLAAMSETPSEELTSCNSRSTVDVRMDSPPGGQSKIVSVGA